MVIAFIHQKGGTGKSTLTIASAMYLAAIGKRVVIVDADSQGTSLTWGRRFGSEFRVDVQSRSERLLVKDVRDAKGRYDVVLVDLPPTVTPQTEKAVEVADLLLIPMRASQADLWALDRLVGLILVSDRKPPPPYRVVFNQTEAEAIKAFRKPLSMRGAEICDETIPFHPDWMSIYNGAPLKPEMEMKIAHVLSELAPPLQ